jgi:hypothetical protein
MKLKTVVFAAGLIAIPALAFAQSAPAPVNQSGPGVTRTQAPTDMGSGNVTGNTKATPTRGAKAMKHSKMSKRHKGAAPTTGSNVRERKERNASPASPMEGAEKEK